MAIMRRIDRSAHLKGATVNPYHHRFLFRRRLVCLPYIQIQAVFALIVKRCCLAETFTLMGTLSIVISLVHAIIGNNVHWVLPTQVAHRLLAHKRNTPKGNDVVGLFTDEGSVNAFYRQRLVVIAVGNLLILAVLSPQLRFFLSKGIVLRYRVITCVDT